MDRLHDVSFSIPAGQIVGLYVQESGRVLGDGVGLTMVDTSWVVGPIISCRS